MQPTRSHTPARPCIVQCEDPALAPDLARVGRETFSEKFGPLYKPEDLQLFLDGSHTPDIYRTLIADPACALWLVTENENPLGYCVVGPSTLPVPDDPPSAGELVRLYLTKTAQGRGLGRQLMKLALAWMTPRFDRIFLSVYAFNEGAQRFYQRFGFEKIHDYHYMVGNHADPEWIMERKRSIMFD